MIETIIFGSIVLAMVVGGKALLSAMAAWPVIGSFAAWYYGVISPLPDGIVANLIYGTMAAQVIILPLAVLLYGPRGFKRIAALCRRDQPVSLIHGRES